MTIWTVIAVLVTVLSLAGPLGNAATPDAGVALAVMHLVVGAVVILGFRRTARWPPPARRGACGDTTEPTSGPP
jgi:hypothetical protein